MATTGRPFPETISASGLNPNRHFDDFREEPGRRDAGTARKGWVMELRDTRDARPIDLELSGQAQLGPLQEIMKLAAPDVRVLLTR